MIDFTVFLAECAKRKIRVFFIPSDGDDKARGYAGLHVHLSMEVDWINLLCEATGKGFEVIYIHA